MRILLLVTLLFLYSSIRWKTRTILYFVEHYFFLWYSGGLRLVGWLFGFNGSLRQYFSLYRAVSQREGERRETIDESKNVQTTPTRTHCKRNRPLPYCNQCCRTHRYWKFTQHHRTTQPPPGGLRDRFGPIYSI